MPPRIRFGELQLENYRSIPPPVADLLNNLNTRVMKASCTEIASWSKHPVEEVRSMAVLYLRVYSESGIENSVLTAIRDNLYDAYRHGDAFLKEMILLIVLEHLFQVLGLRRFFATWNESADTASAYAEAVELADTWNSMNT